MQSVKKKLWVTLGGGIVTLGSRRVTLGGGLAAVWWRPGVIRSASSQLNRKLSSCKYEAEAPFASGVKSQTLYYVAACIYYIAVSALSNVGYRTEFLRRAEARLEGTGCP